MDDEGDDRLVEAARRGDPAAYAELVCRYRERIYQTIFRLTRNHDDTDDLAQETFLRAFRELGRFRGQAGFYTWIYRIALNLSFNLLNKRKKEMRFREQRNRPPEPNRRFPPAPERASSRRELQARIAAAVDSLARPYRSAFILVAYQDLTHGQAARVLGCSEKTVSWRMHKARKFLREELRPFLEEAGDGM